MNIKVKPTIFWRKERIEFFNRINAQNINIEESISQLCNEIFTYAQGFKVIKEFEKAGLIIKKTMGRKKQILLTEKGKKVYQNLNIIKQNI